MTPTPKPIGRIILSNLALLVGAIAFALLFPSEIIHEILFDWVSQISSDIKFATYSPVQAALKSYQLRLFVLIPPLMLISWYINIPSTGPKLNAAILWIGLSALLLGAGLAVYWIKLGVMELAYLASFKLPILYDLNAEDQNTWSSNEVISLFMKSTSLSLLPLLVVQYLFAIYKGWLSPPNLKRGFIGTVIIPWVLAYLFTATSLTSTVLMGVPIMAVSAITLMIGIGIAPERQPSTINKELFAWVWLAPWIFMALVAAV